MVGGIENLSTWLKKKGYLDIVLPQGPFKMAVTILVYLKARRRYTLLVDSAYFWSVNNVKSCVKLPIHYAAAFLAKSIWCSYPVRYREIGFW